MDIRLILLGSIGVITMFIFLYVLANVQRTLRIHGGLRGEILRKTVHVSLALVAVYAPFILSKWELISVLMGIGAMGALVRIFGNPQKLHSVKRLSWGEILFPAGIALAAWFFLPHSLAAYHVGLLVLAVSDTSAALIGTWLGSHPLILGSKTKTVEGSAAFSVSVLVIFLVFGAPFSGALIGSVLILMLVEGILIWGADNLAIPALAGALFLWTMTSSIG